MGKVFEQAKMTDVKPMFSACANADQSVASNTNTKVMLQTKEFDLTSAFDNTTNYRFQPTKQGYYHVNYMCRILPTANTVIFPEIWKNGVVAHRGNELVLTTNSFTQLVGSTILYLNGSTDYLELYFYSGGGSAILGYTSSTYTSRFQAYYIANGI